MGTESGENERKKCKGLLCASSQERRGEKEGGVQEQREKGENVSLEYLAESRNRR